MTTTDNSRADALTEALIRKIAAQYCEYDTDSKTYNILRYECEADFFNCIRELLDAFPDLQPAAAPIDTPTDREFALSAAICVHPKGVYGDEGGSMCCPITHTRDASFAPPPADERAAKKPDAMTKAVKQLADWLLTEPNDGNPLCFAGPPEPFVLGLSRVKMRSVAGDEWTLIAGLQEGWPTAEQRAATFWRIAKLEREEVAREEAVAQYKQIREQAHNNPIGYIEADELEKLGSPDFADVPENHVRLWHPVNPPSRALIAVYCAPQKTGEPFGWISRHDFEIGDGVALVGANTKADDVPLYTAPQPAQADAREGLTDEQRGKAINAVRAEICAGAPEAKAC